MMRGTTYIMSIHLCMSALNGNQSGVQLTDRLPWGWVHGVLAPASESEQLSPQSEAEATLISWGYFRSGSEGR